MWIGTERCWAGLLGMEAELWVWGKLGSLAEVTIWYLNPESEFFYSQ